jgi:adenylate kinase family enzyme
MITNFTVTCKCGFKSNVKYGRSSKKVIFEVFSCPKCQNLFSLNIESQRKCNCGETKLTSYNPNKLENLKYYKKMKDNIEVEKVKEITEFWEKIEDIKCPKCEKNTLNWKNDT